MNVKKTTPVTACRPSLHPIALKNQTYFQRILRLFQCHAGIEYLIAPFINADITAIPNPLPLTIKISTNSRRLLKYWATIKVEQSRVIPTPTPTTVP